MRLTSILNTLAWAKAWLASRLRFLRFEETDHLFGEDSVLQQVAPAACCFCADEQAVGHPEDISCLLDGDPCQAMARLGIRVGCQRRPSRALGRTSSGA